MAVCNLFNTLSNASGNFLLFSQYVEDITKNYSYGENYKIVPSKFVAFDIDYSKSKIQSDFNTGLPEYFQNMFENGCAYLRGKEGFDWRPDLSRNMFWNCMFDNEIITSKTEDNIEYIPEVVYFGDINMHSYNEHKGMGYGEIYCYIPTDALRTKCQVIKTLENRQYDASNESATLEGHNISFDKNLYPQKYYYGRDYRMSFDDSSIASMKSDKESKYNINTIVVLYSIYSKENDEWIPVYEDIPLGMYLTGNFDNDNNLTNEITKYVTTSYGSGTSYGLRICTRFSALPNGAMLSSSDIVVDDSSYANVCQLMTAMSENLSRMLDVTRSVVNTTQEYKETLSVIKNNRTNVPYVHEINGKDFWFVNGRVVSSVKGDEQCCNEYAEETVKKRINNLMDNDPTNDYTYIEDPNGCDCLEYSTKELAGILGLNADDYEDSGYSGGIIDVEGLITEDNIATTDDITSELYNNNQ